MPARAGLTLSHFFDRALILFAVDSFKAILRIESRGFFPSGPDIIDGTHFHKNCESFVIGNIPAPSALHHVKNPDRESATVLFGTANK